MPARRLYAVASWRDRVPRPTPSRRGAAASIAMASTIAKPSSVYLAEVNCSAMPAPTTGTDSPT